VRNRNPARTQKQTGGKGAISAACGERNSLLRRPAFIPDQLLFGIAKSTVAVDNHRSVMRQSRWLRQMDAVRSLALRPIRLPAIGTVKHWR